MGDPASRVRFLIGKRGFIVALAVGGARIVINDASG